tara:strand:+ start:402 stop:704 length:303 start_codon:yes stop_codon:yes gene_type:complete
MEKMFKKAYNILKMTAILAYNDKDVRKAVLMSPIDLSLLSLRETIDMLMEVIGSENRLSAMMLKLADKIQNEELTDDEKEELKSSLNDLFAQMQKEAKTT